MIRTQSPATGPALAEAIDDWAQRVVHACVELMLCVRPGETVDAGCGMGRRLPGLLARGADVIAVDADKESLAQAERRCPPEARHRLHVVLGDLRNLPLERLADRAVCPDSLAHVTTDADRLEVVRELRRILKPGAMLVIAVPRRRRRDTSQPRSPLTPRQLGSLLRHAGLVDVEIRGASVLPRLGRSLGAQRRLCLLPFSRFLGHVLVARARRPLDGGIA